jgi:hypothetical protein
MVWPATIAGVIVLGIALILVTIGGPNAASVPPIIGDHWHAAYGIDDCGTFIPPLTDVVSDTLGIHTHGDSLIHIHPFTSAVTGKDANLRNWGKTTGLQLTDTSIKAAGIDVENGQTCDGKPAVVQMKVWNDPSDDTGHLVTKDLASFNPQDQNLVTIAFLPAGDPIPRPPDSALANLAVPADVVGTTIPGAGATTTTTAPGTTTTSTP